MKRSSKNTIVLTGGGTAGHIWPHFALFEGDSLLAEAEKNNKLNVIYVGSNEGMEKAIVKSEKPHWQYKSISTGKLRRYFSFKNFIDPFKIFFGILQAFFLIIKEKPCVIFSKGGFVSAPVVWAAWLNRIPVVIHESDATPALATKLTLPFCQKALFAFPETVSKIMPYFAKKSEVVGLPLRASLFGANKEEAYHFFKFSPEKKTLLIFGGSLGAKSLNDKIYAILDKLTLKYQVIHITGKGHQKNLNSFENYRQYEFLTTEMKYVYAISDLAICRAGASSIFELAAARIPMILFPLGLNASRGDQIINATIFHSHGWAQKIDELKYQQEVFLNLLEDTIKNIETYKDKIQTAPTATAAHDVARILSSFFKN